MHLPQLIDSIHAVHSDCIAPYLDHNRMEICTRWAFLHSSICPCPMDCLAGFLIEAVESVDERPAQCLKGGQFVAELPKENKIGVEEVYRA